MYWETLSPLYHVKQGMQVSQLYTKFLLLTVTAAGCLFDMSW